MTAGVLWDDDESVELAKRISESSKCTLRGLYCHEGQSYHSRGTDEIQETGSLVAEHILNLASRYLNYFQLIQLKEIEAKFKSSNTVHRHRHFF